MSGISSWSRVDFEINVKEQLASKGTKGSVIESTGNSYRNSVERVPGN